MISRRTFFRRLGTAAAAVAAAQLIPAPIAAWAESIAHRSALAYLLDIWRDQMHGIGCPAIVNFTVSPALYAAFESELMANQRFGSGDAQHPRSLMFKSGTVVPDTTGFLTDWGYSVSTVYRNRLVRGWCSPDGRSRVAGFPRG